MIFQYYLFGFFFLMVITMFLYIIRCQHKTRKQVDKIDEKVTELVEYKENNIQVELVLIVNEEMSAVVNPYLPEGQAFWHYLKKKIEDVTNAYHVFREHLNQNNDLLLLNNEAFKNTLLGNSRSEFNCKMPDWIFQKLDAANETHYKEFVTSLSLTNTNTENSEKLQIVKTQMFVAFRKNIIATKEAYGLCIGDLYKKLC